MAKKKTDTPRKRKRPMGNPKRQADAQLRGYLYQIWHSVNAWLDLADDESLYLEGAEDFDIESNGTFTATQVKHTRRNITLKSQDAVDAINNFWELRTNNPDHRVKFRFLTRSKIGKEQANPFGKGKSGIEVWSRCSGDRAAIEKISNFLQTEQGILDELKTFLKQASSQEIYEQLIGPIAWETGSKDASSVEQSINDKLILHGNQLGFLPSDSKKVTDRLLKEALTVATQKENRELTKVRFLEIFEAQVTQSVPTSHLRYLQRQTTIRDSVALPFIDDSSDLAIQSQSPIQIDVPLPHFDVVPRKNLLTSIQTKLQSDGIAIIHGGTGKGKTTLAKLAANDIDGAWFWLNFTNKDSSQVAQLLQQVSIAISNQSAQINVVLDDLNLHPQELRTYEEVLGIVIYRVRERGAKLLITSQQKPPDNFIRCLGLSKAITVDVPNFTISEIEHFAAEMGCPTGDAGTWKALIPAHTGGHPRLVHAWLVRLKEKGWDEQNILSNLLHPPEEVVEEREAARQLLIDLPENQREFLYRLSLMSTMFRRDYARNIGEIPKPISYPGDIFSQLVGPWIDQVSENYYTISPLLTNAAKEVWSESEVNRLHAEIANAILEAKDLTTIEARAVLLHSITGQNKKGFISVVHAVTTSEDDWENFYQEFPWLTYVKTNPPEELFPGDALANYFFRLLQYRTAVKVKAELAPKILELWDKETKTQRQAQDYQFFRYMLAMEALIYNQVSLPAKQMVNYLQEVVEITNSDAEVQDVHGYFIEQIGEHKTGRSGIFSILFSFVHARPSACVLFLNDLIGALDDLQPEIRDLLLANFKDESIDCQILINGIWLSEAGLEKPDWKRCLEVFDKVIEKTIKWGYPHIAAASARGKAIIYDEKLNDPDTAHKVLQDITSKVGTLPVIEEEQAVVYLRQKRHKEALNIYDRILPKWNPPSEQLNIGPLEEYRQAAICAASLGDWKKAATFLEDGAKRTEEIENGERYISLYADAGFAKFKAGNMLDSIKLLHLALQNFETLPQNITDLKYFTLKKRLAGSIGWIAYHEDENYTSESEEPSIGFCSNPETNEEVLNLPDYPIEYAWAALAKIEYKFGNGTIVLEHALQIADRGAEPVLNGTLSLLEIQYDFRNKTFDQLPQRIHQMVKACGSVQKHNQRGEGIGKDEIDPVVLANFTSVENISAILVSALLTQLIIGKDGDRILDVWRANSSKLSIKENMTKALNLIESMLAQDKNKALIVMRTQNTKPEERLLAVLKVVQHKQTSPENLFYAHTLITTGLVDPTWLDPILTSLAEFLSLQWLEKIKFRAALKMPRITVPQIEQACNSSETGKKKIGQILLAAHQAISLRVDSETLQQFRSWAESESEWKQAPATRKNPAAQRLIKAMEKPPHLTHEDVEALNQSIKEGKIPIKFDSIFEPDEQKKE